jgi:aminoglycoside phosphotransferase (APT) family kinase protein
MANEDFAQNLHAAVAVHIGSPGTIRDLRQLTGGANKTTWSFAADIGQKRERFILQLASNRPDDQPNPLADQVPRVTADEDARLMIEAVKVGVPAPHVRAILEPSDGMGPGYVTEWVDGETLATRILREERFVSARAKMAAQCGDILAKIHQIRLDAVPFLKPQDPAKVLHNQRLIVDFHGLLLPALEYGLKWAEKHLPKTAKTTVVHGDFRHGNFIVGEDGIRCVLDWEVGQAGDPMQDLGWVCVKTWRFGGKRPVGGFGSREDLFAAYEKASGESVDPEHVKWWEAFGSVRWAVGCLGLGTRGVQEVNVERSAIGRRIEEPLWDFFSLIEGRD